MEEHEFYKPIGEWLVEEKGCQSEEFFYGYAIEKPIPHKETGAVRRLDVVGVRYERSGSC